MRVQSILVACLALVLSAGAARCQEKYTIVVKELKAGDSARIELKDHGLFKSSALFDKEKEVKSEQRIAKYLVFTQTVLTRPDPVKLPTKLRRVYELAQTLGFDRPDQKEPSTLPYQGKTVLIEKKEGRFEFHIEGGKEITNDGQLESEFNSGDQEAHKKVFLPDQPVAVGQAWKIDPKSLVTAHQKDKIEILKAEGTAKLVKAYRKDGKLYGNIEAQTTVEVRITAGPGAVGPVKAENKSTMKLNFEGCIDGSVVDWQVVASADLNSTDTYAASDLQPAGKVTTSGSTKLEQSWKQVKQK